MRARSPVSCSSCVQLEVIMGSFSCFLTQIFISKLTQHKLRIIQYLLSCSSLM